MSEASGIALIDYGSGNLRSVSKAFQHLGLSAAVTSDAAAIESAAAVVLPGVGAFGDSLKELRARGIMDVTRERAREARDGGRPFLGICVGMQILVQAGEEDPDAAGLGVVEGSCPKLRGGDGLKIPHMGWNRLRLSGKPPLFAGLSDQIWMYFVHSYHVAPSSPDTVSAWTDYGEPVAAALSLGNLHATQFHPEKSQSNGLRVLQNFGSLVESFTAA